MTYQLLTGDNRQVLRTLPEKSIHAIITSPPYFNLRAYLAPICKQTDFADLPMFGGGA